MLFVTFIVPFLANHVLALEAPISGYKVQEIIWKVDPFDNGTIIEIPGTVQDVIAELDKINPQYLEHHFEVEEHENNDKLTITHERDSHVLCDPRPGQWTPTWRQRISEGISYLRRINAHPPVLSAGPRTCERVSCSWLSAIWWCNDNEEPLTLGSFRDIAQCAQEILDTCDIPDHPGLVVGQNFNDANWNCIVRWDTNHC